MLLAWASEGQAQTKTLTERAAEAAAARLRDGLRNAAAAPRTSEVAGTYTLTEFYGKPLPASAPSEGTAGQLCPGGGKAVSAVIASGFIQLQPDGTALMRATALGTCQMPNGTTRTVDLPQDLNGRYSAADKQVKLAMGRNGTIALTHDAAAGTLRWKDAGALWRKSPGTSQAAAGNAASRAADAALTEALRNVQAVRLPEPTPASASPNRDHRAVAGEVLEGTDENGRRRYVVVFQRDSALEQGTQDEEGRPVRRTVTPSPFAAVGDSLTIVFGTTPTTQARGRVIARSPTIDRPGWAYLLEGIAAFPEEGDRGYINPSVSTVALSKHFTPRPLVKAGASVRATFKPLYLADLDRGYRKQAAQLATQAERARLRRMLFGASGEGGLKEAAMIQFRGPRGTMHIVSIQGDEPSDIEEGFNQVTYLLDGDGRIVQKHAGGSYLLGIGDVDGDSVDELVTRDGLIHWDGRKWVFPPPLTEYCD
jgi:ribosomal protein S11